MIDIIIAAVLGFIGLFIGYTVGIGVALGIVAYCSVRKKAIPKFLKVFASTTTL